jgi:hypothetical protein
MAIPPVLDGRGPDQAHQVVPVDRRRGAAIDVDLSAVSRLDA